jgi:hypothetical protein
MATPTTGIASTSNNAALSQSTVIAGSGGLTLPQATLSVGSTTGTLSVATGSGPQTVAYTGASGGVFTGCSGGTGTMSIGRLVLGTSLDVSSTSGFPSNGTVSVWASTGMQTVDYAGLTATRFLACVGGNGALLTGNHVASIPPPLAP